LGGVGDVSVGVSLLSFALIRRWAFSSSRAGLPAALGLTSVSGGTATHILLPGGDGLLFDSTGSSALAAKRPKTHIGLSRGAKQFFSSTSPPRATNAQ